MATAAVPPGPLGSVSLDHQRHGPDSDGCGRWSGGRVLVLNATYEPLGVVAHRRAIVLVLREKAEVVERNGAMYHSEHLSIEAPSVIRLRYYVSVPHRLHVAHRSARVPPAPGSSPRLRRAWPGSCRTRRRAGFRAEAWPDVRDAEESHDALLTLVAIPASGEGTSGNSRLASRLQTSLPLWTPYLEQLVAQRRVRVMDDLEGRRQDVHGGSGTRWFCWDYTAAVVYCRCPRGRRGDRGPRGRGAMDESTGGPRPPRILEQISTRWPLINDPGKFVLRYAAG